MRKKPLKTLLYCLPTEILVLSFSILLSRFQLTTAHTVDHHVLCVAAYYSIADLHKSLDLNTSVM